MSDENIRPYLSTPDNNVDFRPGELQDWSSAKADWASRAWFASAPEASRAKLADFYKLFRKGFEDLRDGKLDINSPDGKLLEILRPGPIDIARNVLTETEDAPKVARILPWSPHVQYRDPLFKSIGSRLVVLLADVSYDKDPGWHSHIGVEFVFLLEGKLRVEFRVPNEQGSSFVTKEANLDANEPHRRTVWFHSEVPHRAVLTERNKSARALIFYSEPLGATALVEQEASRRRPRPGEPAANTAVAIGAKYLADEAQEPERLWALFSGIGARIERARRMRGLTSTQLAQIARIQPSQLSRYEDSKVTVPIETAMNLAAALDVQLGEILPHDIPAHIKGCYLSSAGPTWRLASGSEMPREVAKKLEEKRKAAKLDQRVQLPFIWRDYQLTGKEPSPRQAREPRPIASSLLVLPGGSPRTKSLLPVTLYVLKPGKTPHEKVPARCRTLAEHNYSFLLENQTLRNGLWNHASNMVLYVREGSITLRVCRYADLQLFPSPRAEAEAPQDSPYFRAFRLSKGDLVHLNCAHLHRFEVDDSADSRDYHCALLCVIGRRHLGQTIQIPERETLFGRYGVMPVRAIDDDFMKELAAIRGEGD